MRAYWLREADSGDLDILYRIHRAALGPYVEQTWGVWDEPAQLQYWRERFDPARIQAIETDDGTIGYLELVVHDDHLEVANIEVSPRHQGRGIGTSLLKSILEEGRRSGHAVRLQVLKVNTARRLYERLGLVQTGETETHYLMATVPTGLGTARTSEE
jgi:ribosomal protein S18 acetylase RimI-like enzyme